MTCGDPPSHDRGFNSVFTEDIIERRGLKAWIEMTRGTAGFYIRYFDDDKMPDKRPYPRDSAGRASRACLYR